MVSEKEQQQALEIQRYKELAETATQQRDHLFQQVNTLQVGTGFTYIFICFICIKRLTYLN